MAATSQCVNRSGQPETEFSSDAGEYFMSVFVLQTAYPVLMEMISISGFFLIFGKSRRAPPKRFPFSFFWPSRRTEWPSKQTQTHLSLHFTQQSAEARGAARNYHTERTAEWMNKNWCQKEDRIKDFVPFQHNHMLASGHGRLAMWCHFPECRASPFSCERVRRLLHADWTLSIWRENAERAE